MDHLDLQNLTLVTEDWGGPIGLEFVRRQPERIKRLVISTTWCWPVHDEFHVIWFSFFMSNWVEQYLLKRHNIFVNRLMPMAVGDKGVLTPEVMVHYRNALASPDARAVMAAFPGHIAGASDWLEEIWRERATFADKPSLIA